jgi:hypothetical protein
MEFHATDKDVPLDNKWRTEIVRLNEMIAKTSFNLAAAQTEISFYRLILMMIKEGCEDPRGLATKTLDTERYRKEKE